MLTCPQFEGMNVYEHGLDVHARYLDLKVNDKPLLKWRMPEWVDKLKPHALPLETMRLYQIFHDCGKPFCRIVDGEGKQHFPNHARISYETWMQYAETPEDEQIGRLIQMDMDAHTLRGEAADEFVRRPEAASLILTGLAEIHSNAAHLGQLDSDQFKMKWKVIDKIGRKWVAMNA